MSTKYIWKQNLLVKDYGYKYFIEWEKNGYVIVRDSESILIGARIWRFKLFKKYK